jgi:PKD repeat protein
MVRNHIRSGHHNRKVEEKMNIVYELHKVVKTSGGRSWFLITAALILILFLPISGSAQDPHGFFGYYQPPPDCTQCHAPLLVENHQGNCWVCHNTDYSLKICTSSNYPPDLNFTTVCANYQTGIKEPFSCGDCHVQAGDHTIAHDQTLLPSSDCSQCHIADAPSEHSKYNLSCSICHNSSNTNVQNAIARGKSGTPVYCTDCHGLIDHQVHKNTYLPFTDCSVCHLTSLGLQADVVNEHAKKNIDCNTCHSSNNPTIEAAITRGIAGNPVYCADCHPEFGNHARMHDQTILTSTACGACHVANAVSEHQGHGPHSIGCLPCHANADAKILTAIYSGMSGQSIACDNCHLISGNRPPIANCGADKVVSTGFATQFSGSSSYDHDGTIVGYEWDFGDSTPKVNGITVSHTYTTAGIYQVNLAVTDNQGAIDTDTSAITVRVQTLVIDKILGVKEPGLIVRIIGQNFGDTQGDSVVHIGPKIFNSSSPGIKLWSDTKIRIKLPKYQCGWFKGQNYRYIKIWVTVDGVDSNKKKIKVMKPSTCP